MSPTPKKPKSRAKPKPKGQSLKVQTAKKSKSPSTAKPSPKPLKSPSSPKSKAKTPSKAKPKGAPSRKTPSRDRALVVGISAYPSPLTKLPAVAADVREMGKILRSKDGTFRSTGVAVLTEKLATRKEILAALRATFGGATAPAAGRGCRSQSRSPAGARGGA